MRFMFLAFGLMLLSTQASTAWAFGQPENSAVELETKDVDGAKQFVLTVKAKSGMIVNFEAPWKLDVQDHDGLTLAKTTYNKGDMDEKLPGFVVAAKTDKPQGAFAYSLTAFVCTKDKSQCYREVHKGKQTWTAAK